SVAQAREEGWKRPARLAMMGRRTADGRDTGPEELAMPIHSMIAALLLAAAGDEVAPPVPEGPRAQLEWVERRVQTRQPTAAERRFDEICWARDIRKAIRLARRLDRPVFLFTHDGHMNVGRC